MGFGGEFGGSRAARADGAGLWTWDHRAEQLARMERDLTAHTAALETADAAKWVNRQEYCSTQPRANLCIDTRDPRDEARVPRAEWPAGPDIPPGERRWDSEANAEAAGRQERMALVSGYGTVSPSSWHIWSAI